MRPARIIWQIMSNSLTRKGLLAAIFVATFLLTGGYLMGRLWLEVPVVFLLGILWGVCVLRDIHWVTSLLFTAMMGAAVIGYLARLPHLLMLAAGCTSVLAWDLHHFEARLLDLEEQATLAMEKHHLQRSVLVLGASFLVIAAGSRLQIRIQFILLVFVTIIAIVILNQIMIMVRKAGKPAPPKE
jgi:hypothetical protein